MKKLIFVLFLSGFVFSVLAADDEVDSTRYTIYHRNDRDKNFVFSVIKDNQGKVFGHFALVDPEPFYFYSVESDPDLFPYIDGRVGVLAERKNRGEPVAMIVVDFSNQEKINRPLNFKYLVNYFLLISFAKPYLRKVEILNPCKISRRFFVEIKVAEKSYFGAMDLNRSFDTGGAKKFIKKISGAGEISVIVPVLENVPIKMVSFIGSQEEILYESHPGHKKYTCIFLAGSN